MTPTTSRPDTPNAAPPPDLVTAATAIVSGIWPDLDTKTRDALSQDLATEVAAELAAN